MTEEIGTVREIRARKKARAMFGDQPWIAECPKDDLILAIENRVAPDGSPAPDYIGGNSVEELRSMAREKFGPGAWIASCRRETLLEALEAGKIPDGATVIATRKSASREEFASAVQNAVKVALESIPVPEGDGAFDASQAASIAKAVFAEEIAPVVNRFSSEFGNVKSWLEQFGEKVGLRVTELTAMVNGARENAEEMVRSHINTEFGKLVAHVDATKAEFAAMTDARLDEKLETLGDALTVKLQKKLVKEITIKRPDGTKHEAGLQHKQFGELLQVVACGVNAFLVGPAASGKTRAAEEVAKVEGLSFFPQSFNSQTPSSQLFGYMDAQGRYVTTVFRQAFEAGGLWLADEIDRANGNVLTALNAALENGYCSFPDKVVKRHEKFVCIASANTWGRGADRMYVGANALDEATLNRFIQIEWEYDEELERILGQNNAWVDRVQAIRKAVVQERVRCIVSPRASIYGSKLLAAGIKQARVEELVIWRGMDEATRKKVLASVPKAGVMVRISEEG